jgi:hypothetical protein
MLNAFSKSFGSSEAPTCFAISTKRLWRSASVSLAFVADLRGMKPSWAKNQDGQYSSQQCVCNAQSSNYPANVLPDQFPRIFDGFIPIYPHGCIQGPLLHEGLGHKREQKHNSGNDNRVPVNSHEGNLP